jgi:putative NADH-flavin reductase
VNGAGGGGGSISILAATQAGRDELVAEAHRRGHTVLALSLARQGARVTSTVSGRRASPAVERQRPGSMRPS